MRTGRSFTRSREDAWRSSTQLINGLFHGGVVPAAARAEAAVAIAVEHQSVQATDVRLAYAPVRAGCDAPGSFAPTLRPREGFTVCVTVTVRSPLLPLFIDANTATGEFVVERDRYVDA